ncbi:hypothetical protein BDV12DRAFT_193416 [Aspergillus spectabilis]
MEYQPLLTLRSPTGPSSSMHEIDHPSLPLDLICGLGNYMAFQGLHQSTGIVPGRSTASPTSSPLSSSIDGTQREVRHSNPNPNPSPTTDADASEPKNVKRRVQNREAQRRFRERKEQQKKLLQKNAEDIRNEYQILLKQYAQTASDVTRLVKENDVLRFEVRNLRQQWRLVFAVLQRLQGAQSSPALADDTFPLVDLQDYLEELASESLSNSTHYIG